MSEHSTEWLAVGQSSNPDGSRSPVVRHRVLELATGKNYLDDQGQWQVTQELFELTPRGAVARFGPHKVILAPNLNTAGAVDILTPEGQRLRLHLIGLSYYDSQSGASVLLDEVADCQAELLPPNQILFRNAFTKINATVRYTYTRAGLAQDVILHEQPPAPEQFGFSNEYSRIEVLTEFTEDSPMPEVSRHVLTSVTDPNQRRQMAAPDFTDDTLGFGSMRMGPGRAFTLPEGEPREVSVGKRFEVIEGRRILFESVAWPEIEPWMDGLPRREAAIERAGDSKRMAGNRVLPRRLVASSSMDASSVRVASAPPAPGIVLDYDLSGTLANFRFTNGVTYCVSGIVNLTGTTVFQSAIVKYAPGGRLNILGSMLFQTELYAPIVFTARDDNTVGQTAPGSDGDPSGTWFADPALYVYGASAVATIKHARFNYAKRAVMLSGVPSGQRHELRHVQMVSCGAGVNVSLTEVALRNVLMHGVVTNFVGMSGIARLEHATIRNASWLNYNGACSTLALTNCIVAGVTNALGAYTGVNNHVAATDAGLFVQVGAGANYLPSDSTLRGAGTTAIQPALLAELAQFTVDAPWDIQDPVTADTTLSPQVLGDVGPPSLGYHYPIADYAVNALHVQGATLTLTNGVTMAVYGNTGLWLDDGAHLVSEGSPLRPNRLVGYVAVQEQPLNWGEAVPGQVVLLNPYTQGAPSTIRCRFTELRVLDGGWPVFADGAGWKLSSLALRDCRLTGGSFYAVGASGGTLDVLNTLFEGVAADIEGVWALTAHQNLFREGVLTLWQQGGAWTFRDNVFDRAGLDQLVGPDTHDHNAYVGMGTRLSPPAGTDQVLPSVAWQVGPLGTNYLPVGSSLINAGSRAAGAAGLYHYTTLTDQTLEGASQVDIGLHYVALVSGLPKDTDGDGLPDYVEDADGDGVVDGGETSVALVDTDYDGRSDFEEWGDGTNPNDPASVVGVRLGYWRFNAPTYLGETGQTPTQPTTNLQNPVGWSGNVLRVNSASAANLRYRDVEPGGQANVNCRQGTIRFWLKPDWVSGAGPGAWGRFIEMGDGTSGGGWWVLSVNANGTSIRFETRLNGSAVTHVEATNLGWTLNGALDHDWHEIVLTYSEAARALYIDGTLRASSTAGVLNWPTAATRAAYGLNVGSNRNGSEQVKGHIDELETFNWVIDGEEVAAHYIGMIVPAATAETDPAPTRFSVGFNTRYTRDTTVTAWFNGWPAGLMATQLADPATATNIVWVPTASPFAVPLGQGEGVREVWVGVKGLSGRSRWQMTPITVDTTPPVVTLAETTPLTTSRPVIQIVGGSQEQLASATYDMQNVAGNLAGQEASLKPRAIDPETGLLLPATLFQCYDVELANGLNTITLRVEDLAGNVTVQTHAYTLDVESDNTPPVVTVHWPPNGSVIAAASFTLRGLLDDPTATITVAGLGEEAIEGIVERDGQFWVEDLPLAVGVNGFSITAKDAKGNQAVLSWTVQRSAMLLTIDEVPEASLTQIVVDVTGSISVTDHTVWVNGVKALWLTQPPGGPWTWRATAVPLNEGGTAMIQARAIPNSDNGGNGGVKEPFGNGTLGNPVSAAQKDTDKDKDKPAAWYVSRYNENWTMTRESCHDIGDTISISQTKDVAWRDNMPGLCVETANFPNGYWSRNDTHWPAEKWPRNSMGSLTQPGVKTTTDSNGSYPPQPWPPLAIPFESCFVLDRFYGFPCEQGGWTIVNRYIRSAATTVKLHTGGKGKSGRRNLFSFNATARECLEPRYVQGFPLGYEPETREIPGPGIRILKKRLGSDNRAYHVLPDDSEYDITPDADASYYHFDVWPTKHRLLIKANAHSLAEDKVAPSAQFCVGQKVTLESQFVPEVPGIARKQVEWVFDGEFVNKSWQLTRIETDEFGVEHTVPYGSVNYRINPALLEVDPTAAWWKSGGWPKATYKATIAAYLDFQNGAYRMVSSSAVLGMHKPRAELPAAGLRNPTAQIVPGEGSDEIRVVPDFIASTKVTTLIPGEANYVQLISRDAVSDTPPYRQNTHGAFWADNGHFYNETNTDIFVNSSGVIVQVQDGPGWAVFSWAAIDDQFRSYCMFRPTVGDRNQNIFVTLSRIDWWWGASAYPFTATSSGCTWQPASDFPEWACVLINGLFYP